MSRNGGTTAHPHRHNPFSEAVAKRRLREARHREQTARTRKARNLWRRLVKKRTHQLRQAIERRKANQRPHIVVHKHASGGFHLTCEGGTPAERLLYAARYAHRVARLHYLEGGTYLGGFALHNVPSDWDRSDCSWWYCELRRICGLPDPLGGDTVRYTGSILEKGREVSRHYAETHTGVAVVFGAGTAFHVGMSTGSGPNIWQHGTATFREGTFDEFGAGTQVRYRAFPDA